MRFQLLETEQKQVQLMSGYYEDEYARVNGSGRCASQVHADVQSLPFIR